MISPQLAERLGIPASVYSGTAQLADGREVGYQSAVMDVSVAGMISKNIPVNVMQLADPRVHGLLGINFIRNFVVTLDLRNNQVRFGD